jgi:hypothetical protein
LMVEVAAKAGVANKRSVANKTVARPIPAAERAARHSSGPMVFPQPIMILRTAFPASLPGAMQVLQSEVQQFLQRVAIGFAGPNSQGVIDRRHEDLAVTDLPGAGAGANDLDRLVGEIRCDRDLDP